MTVISPVPGDLARLSSSLFSDINLNIADNTWSFGWFANDRTTHETFCIVVSVVNHSYLGATNNSHSDLVNQRVMFAVSPTLIGWTGQWNITSIESIPMR